MSNFLSQKKVKIDLFDVVREQVKNKKEEEPSSEAYKGPCLLCGRIRDELAKRKVIKLCEEAKRNESKLPEEAKRNEPKLSEEVKRDDAKTFKLPEKTDDTKTSKLSEDDAVKSDEEGAKTPEMTFLIKDDDENSRESQEFIESQRITDSQEFIESQRITDSQEF